MPKAAAPEEEDVKVIPGKWGSLRAWFSGQVKSTSSDSTSDVAVQTGKKPKRGEQPPVRHTLTHIEELTQGTAGRGISFRSKLEAKDGKEISLLSQAPAAGASLQFKRMTGAPHGFSATRIVSTAQGFFHSRVEQKIDTETRAIISGDSTLLMKGKVNMTATDVRGRYSAVMEVAPGVRMTTVVGVDPRDDLQE